MNMSKVGEFLMGIYIEPEYISKEFLAFRMSCSEKYLDELIQGERELTVGDAEKLSQVLGRSVQSWLNIAKTPTIDGCDTLQSVKNKLLDKMLSSNDKEELLALSTTYQRICCTPL